MGPVTVCTPARHWPDISIMPLSGSGTSPPPWERHRDRKILRAALSDTGSAHTAAAARGSGPGHVARASPIITFKFLKAGLHKLLKVQV